MTTAFGESNLNNNLQFINCLQKPLEQRTQAVSKTKLFVLDLVQYDP